MCLCEEFSASCVSNNALRASKCTSLASGLTLNDIQMSCVDHIGGKKMQEEIMFESFHLYPGTDLGQD